MLSRKCACSYGTNTGKKAPRHFTAPEVRASRILASSLPPHSSLFYILTFTTPAGLHAEGRLRTAGHRLPASCSIVHAMCLHGCLGERAFVEHSAACGRDLRLLTAPLPCQSGPLSPRNAEKSTFPVTERSPCQDGPTATFQRPAHESQPSRLFLSGQPSHTISTVTSSTQP